MLTKNFCLEAVSEAIMRFGKPEIFNTDNRLRGLHSRPCSNRSRRTGHVLADDGTMTALSLLLWITLKVRFWRHWLE